MKQHAKDAQMTQIWTGFKPIAILYMVAHYEESYGAHTFINTSTDLSKKERTFFAEVVYFLFFRTRI